MTIWIPEAAIRAMHEELLREHGGLSGAINEQALKATLAKPMQLINYGSPGLAEPAAAYGYGFAKNHCFSDGNKRIALSAIDVFLQLNGQELCALEVDAAVTLLAVAAGEIDQKELASWIRSNMQVLPED